MLDIRPFERSAYGGFITPRETVAWSPDAPQAEAVVPALTAGLQRVRLMNDEIDAGRWGVRPPRQMTLPDLAIAAVAPSVELLRNRTDRAFALTPGDLGCTHAEFAEMSLVMLITGIWIHASQETDECPVLSEAGYPYLRWHLKCLFDRPEVGRPNTWA